MYMDTNTIFGIVGTGLAVVGLIASYYFYKKSIRIKEPVYSIKSTNVISDYASIYENLTVSYKNKKVENFTVSKVLFFNKGAETLNRDDIAKLNPLRIAITSGNILDTVVLQVNNPSSDFNVSLDRLSGSVIIDFEYLNQHQGAVIEVVHTGLSSEDIGVVGDMKEVNGLKGIPPRLMNKTRSGIFSGQSIYQIFKPGNAGLVLIMSTILVTAVAVGYSGLDPWLIVLALLSSAVASTAVIVSEIFYNQKTVIPDGLEKFDE
jgi:hypothetical protein